MAQGNLFISYACVLFPCGLTLVNRQSKYLHLYQKKVQKIDDPLFYLGHCICYYIYSVLWFCSYYFFRSCLKCVCWERGGKLVATTSVYRTCRRLAQWSWLSMQFCTLVFASVVLCGNLFLLYGQVVELEIVRYYHCNNMYPDPFLFRAEAAFASAWY